MDALKARCRREVVERCTAEKQALKVQGMTAHQKVQRAPPVAGGRKDDGDGGEMAETGVGNVQFCGRPLHALCMHLAFVWHALQVCFMQPLCADIMHFTCFCLPARPPTCLRARVPACLLAPPPLPACQLLHVSDVEVREVKLVGSDPVIILSVSAFSHL